MPSITAELFAIPVDDAFLVYTPLQHAAFLTSAAAVNRLADWQAGRKGSPQPGDPELLELVERLEIANGAAAPAPVTTCQGDPQPTTVTLFLTTACNLRCTYCYATAGDTPTRVMSLDVARRGIDFVLANALELGRPEIEIAFHGGGEPTVNWQTLTGAYTYAHEQATAAGMRLRATLASNGVLPDARIDWIVEHLDGVSLSFDGLPEVHDTHRVDVFGVGSSASVIHTIRRFDAAEFNYGLRLTVTREHIPRMDASIRFICQNFRPRRIQVEPAYQLGRWHDAPSAETAEFLAGYREAQASAREYRQEICFSAARLGTLTNHFCGITQDSFCLTSDGNVSACYETFLEENTWAKTFFYGAPEPAGAGYKFDLPVLNHLRSQTVDQRPFCHGCFAKWTCGGDCYHKSLTVNGDGEFQGSDRCHIIRELTKDQILDRIAGSGGLFWHEPRTVASALQGKEILS